MEKGEKKTRKKKRKLLKNKPTLHTADEDIAVYPECDPLLASYPLYALLLCADFAEGEFYHFYFISFILIPEAKFYNI